MEVFSLLIKHPFALASYLLLMMSFASIWIYRHILVWGSLFLLSLIFGYWGAIVDYMAIIPLLLLAACHLILTRDIRSFGRLFVGMTAAIISFGFIFHFVRGFNNLRLMTDWQISPGSLPVDWYLNYDTALIGLFILGLQLPLITTKKECLNILLKTFPWAALTIGITMGVAFATHLVIYDPKIPSGALIWLCTNLFLVVIPEEAFFRGFIQREITFDLPNRASGLLAILVSSLFFTLAQITAMPNFTYLLITFISGLFFGTIYHLTRSIESAIITRFTFNIAHFFFFTYPYLQ